MSMVTPALPVDGYNIHSSEKNKAHPFCRICSIHICNAHDIINHIDFPYFWGEVYTLGERDVIGTLHFSHPCHIIIMTLLAPNYGINMTSFPRHMLGWGTI